MRLVAVALTLACLVLLPTSAEARRIGLISVFATTTRDVTEGRHQLVVKTVRSKKGKVIGSIGQVCTRFDHRQICIGTIEMPLGKIMFMGTRTSARYYVFAVVGGTGIYSGSGGQYAATTITLDPRVEYVLVSLVP